MKGKSVCFCSFSPMATNEAECGDENRIIAGKMIGLIINMK